MTDLRHANSNLEKALPTVDKAGRVTMAEERFLSRAASNQQMLQPACRLSASRVLQDTG